ncbi:MAG: BamA/TamA family outer membrane protein [Thermoanaerobaculum sp.]|nr:BamA/TamA family outer membrane protein [Thermoanaerobaculum sp.]MDW7968021.1 BamA/TamA family outer membrane protein [Thermoanaerobaculum sp.]
MAPSLLMLLAAIPWGQVPITAVRLDAPGAPSPSRLLAIFAVKPGDVLVRQTIREGVQALLASREVEDVTVEVRPEGEGFAVIVRAQAASRISSIRLEGLPARQRGMVAQELGLRVGAPLHVARFESALTKATLRLHGDGYPQAKLEPQLDVNVAKGTVAVTVVATLGPPQILCQLQASGLPWSEAHLWKACDVKPGRRLTGGTREGMRRRLLASLRREGFWQATVEGPLLEPVHCGILARFQVDLGARFSLKVEGDTVGEEVLRESLPFLTGEDGFSEGSEEWLAGRVQRALQRRGFLQAHVQVRREEKTAGPQLVVTVSRGERGPIVAVRFSGLANDGELAEFLQQHVGVASGRLARMAGQTVDQDSLEADRASVLEALHVKGYPQARVEPPRVRREGKGWAVEFPVELGPRLWLGEPTISGWPGGAEEPELPLKRGDPWSPQVVEEAKKTLLSRLAELGFADAEVEAASRCAESSCSVQFQVRPGIPVRVGRVVVAAQGRTAPQVVETVLGLAPGMPLVPEALLEAQRRLLSLGIFERVAVREIPGQETGMVRGLVVETREASTRSLAAGVGWDTEERLRLSASWSELNLWGKARTLSFEGRFSSRTKRFQVNYREPARLGLLGQPTWVAIYRTEENFSNYSLLRRGMWVELGDHLARPRRWFLRYDYQIIAPDAPPEILSSLERNKQHLQLASLTPIVEWDTRDDAFSPRRGMLLSLQWQRAFPVFLADASFSKFSATFSYLQPVAGTVVACGLRGGLIKPYQGGSAVAENLRVPLAVRFFAGGRVSHRAFATDRLGILGQTLRCPPHKPNCSPGESEPLGGAAQLLGSLEWRIPVAGSFGATVFVDSGNTWASGSLVRLADLRWGAGLGLRFDTPVGPLRLEYGWKLDRQRGESRGELFLSFGNPF